MRSTFTALAALLLALPAVAANTWSPSGQACRMDRLCTGTIDTAAAFPRISTQCDSGTFVELGTGDTAVVHVYSCATSSPTGTSDCTRSRAVNEAGAWVDVTIDSTTPRASGLPGFHWLLDVQSGTGTVVVGCGG